MSTPNLRGLLRAHSERSLRVARLTISDFVVDQAEKTRADVSFDYETRQDAPNTFAALQTAFAYSVQTGNPLPISSENSESVVFSSAQVNYAMRFWHDVNHCRRALTFDLVDELELALWHLAVLEREGFTADSLVWHLLHADLLGSVYVMALSRRFPLDQLRFAEGCIADGFDVGLLRELRCGAQQGSVAISAAESSRQPPRS